MANAALAAWGIKFLAAVQSLDTGVKKYNASISSKDPRILPGKIAGSVNNPVTVIRSLYSDLVGILSTVDPGTSGKITSAFFKAFKPITTWTFKDGYAPTTVAQSLRDWYDTYIKPLL